MLSFFRRKSEPVIDTFSQRVVKFWTWFQDVAPRFYATIENGECATLTDETSAKVDDFFLALAGFTDQERTMRDIPLP